MILLLQLPKYWDSKNVRYSWLTVDRLDARAQITLWHCAANQQVLAQSWVQAGLRGTLPCEVCPSAQPNLQWMLSPQGT